MKRFTVQSTEDIQQVIHDNARLHIIGRGTKTGLHHVDCPLLDMSRLSGMMVYQPDEYTFTAYAATPVKEIQAALHEHGQYLPCDPLLVEAGATLGGTIACNLSGSRRFRYGGVRDFFLGATVVDGMGRVFRVGGKVVKNAAGFDLAKFLVGSTGYYMLMLDVTFKVFPDKAAFRSYQFDYPSIDDALSAVFYLNRQPFELDALDLAPSPDGCALITRFSGTSDKLAEQIVRFSMALNQNTGVQTMTELNDTQYWQEVNALHQADSVVKVPLAPKQIPALDAKLKRVTRRYTVGGNIAWIHTDDMEKLSPILEHLNLTGLHILGESASPIVGKSLDHTFNGRVKTVLDPDAKFV